MDFFKFQMRYCRKYGFFHIKFQVSDEIQSKIESQSPKCERS